MSLVQRFMTGDYDVERAKSGTYVKGRFVSGAMEKFKVSGSLQPTNARELKLSEEANRIKQFWKFYTDAPILIGNTATLAKPDVLTINGETYRAMSIMTWANTDLDYFMTVVWREPEQNTDGGDK